ncbi:hypothetical protein [Microbacterium gilvum]|uniref:Bacitracin resistance protein n=1 Tax=Microbacterium gilvum TaxID=1336204 RepID=A0ABP8ZSZ3_9MICO
MAVETPKKRTPVWVVSVVAGAFGLLYAYAVWSGVSYLVLYAQIASQYGTSLTPMAAVVLVLAIAVPVVLFFVALFAGMRRGGAALALLLAGGLMLTAVYWMNAQAYTASTAFLAV